MLGEVFNVPGAWKEGVSPSLRDLSPPVLSEDGGAYLEREVFKKERFPKGQSLGCKIFYQHLQGNHKSAWQWILANRIPILVVRRRNWLNWYISFQLALRENRWIGHTECDAVYENPIIQVDIAKVVLKVREMRTLEERSLIYLDRCPKYSVYYEDLCDNFSFHLEQIIGFLGLSPTNLMGQTKKQQIFDQRAVIENWADLRRVFVLEDDLIGYLVE